MNVMSVSALGYRRTTGIDLTNKLISSRNAYECWCSKCIGACGAWCLVKPSSVDFLRGCQQVGPEDLLQAKLNELNRPGFSGDCFS